MLDNETRENCNKSALFVFMFTLLDSVKSMLRNSVKGLVLTQLYFSAHCYPMRGYDNDSKIQASLSQIAASSVHGGHRSRVRWNETVLNSIPDKDSNGRTV